MKVLHLVSEKSWRGGEQQVAYLIGELQKYKVQNFVGVIEHSQMHQYCQKNNIEYVLIPFGGLQIKAGFRIKFFAQDNQIDVIHMHAAKAHSAAVVSYLLGNKTPMILSKRTDFPIKNNWFSQYKYNCPGIFKILCVSMKIQEILEDGLIDTSKAMTIYSGVNLERFSALHSNSLREKFKLTQEHILVGNTSALAPHKDYYTFIDTAQKLSSQNELFRFVIMGDGPLMTDIQSYAIHKGLEDKVFFTGFLNNIEEALPQLDYFLMTSNEEGLGTSILDAMLCKIPVVATHAGGIPEIVIHQKTGLIASVGDSTLLAQHLVYLQSHQDKKNVLIEKAYQMILKNFSKEITAQKTLAVYQECVRIR